MRAGRIAADLDELVEAAARSSRGGSTTSRRSPHYFPRLLEAYGGDRDAIATFEDVHLGYV